MLFFIFGYDFLVIAVLVVTFYLDWSWCVFLWRFYFLNFVTVIIVILVVTFLTFLIVIVRFCLRCWFDF